MKKLVLLTSLLLANSALAANAENCGTSTQWPTNGVSGWFLEIDYRVNSAYVIKQEDAQTRRAYGYKMTNQKAEGFVLTSRYGDTLVFSKKDADHYGVVYNHESGASEKFDVSCFSNSEVSNIPETDSALAKLKIVSMINNKENKFFTQKSNVEFSILANVLQSSISNVGDWEDTILSPAQAQIIDSGLGLNEKDQKEFQNYKSIIAEDIKNMPGLKQVGYLFGRDWYDGNGTIAFVLQYKNFIVVVPFEFESNAQFGDQRLDYAY